MFRFSHKKPLAGLAVVALATTASVLGTITDAQAAPTPSPAYVQVTGSPFSTGQTTYQATFNPAGTLIATANFGSVSVFSVAPGGALTPAPGSPLMSAQGANDVAFSPNGKFLAVASTFGQTVKIYSVAPSGALAEVPGSPFFAAAGSESVAFSPTGAFLAVGNDNIDSQGVAIYAVDATTGALTEVPGSPFTVSGGFDVPYSVAYSSTGLLATANLSDSVTLFTQNQTTGALTQAPGSPVLLDEPWSVAFDPSGQHLAVPSPDNGGNVSVFDVAPSGALTAVTGSPFAAGNGSVSGGYNATGTEYAVGLDNADSIAGYSVAADGSLAPLPGSPFATGAGSGPSSASFSPSGLIASGDQGGDGDHVAGRRPDRCPRSLRADVVLLR
jgi:6-phosphogluconolactonase (cycloisomerase 2 family)